MGTEAVTIVAKRHCTCTPIARKRSTAWGESMVMNARTLLWVANGARFAVDFA